VYREDVWTAGECAAGVYKMLEGRISEAVVKVGSSRVLLAEADGPDGAFGRTSARKEPR